MQFDKKMMDHRSNLNKPRGDRAYPKYIRLFWQENDGRLSCGGVSSGSA